MQQFQPVGFCQQAIATSLGVMAYYTQVSNLVGLENSPALFLHSLGGGSSAYEWSQLYQQLGDRVRVIAPDLIGWGQSAHPVRDYQVDDYLLIIEELIRALKLQPVTVFASSLMAGIVVQLAVRQPELFRQLVLVCPSGYGDFGADYRYGVSSLVARIPGVDMVLYTLGAANALAVRSFMQRFLFAKGDRITDDIVAAYVASAQQLNAQYSALASLRGDLCFDLALYLPQLKVPTVMVWGDRAWFSKVETGKRLALLNPNAIQEFCVIPEAGVLPHLEVPDQVIAEITPFLKLN
ncbi:alpha/beta fold hydrolase [Leptolyngbya sp. AN02str]|uniref:alpha/beta fold hydrolase n=1 Tax=Leptolyngbya sp. AN02str TaxID=3423363 RepID=UPI003D312426